MGEPESAGNVRENDDAGSIEYIEDVASAEKSILAEPVEPAGFQERPPATDGGETMLRVAPDRAVGVP